MNRAFLSWHWLVFLGVLFSAVGLRADNADFHNAPESARAMKNPFEGDADAAKAGKPMYHLRCARCHGEKGEGSGNIPELRGRTVQRVTPGELFWFVTKGDVKNGMPAWSTLPEEQRWKIVTYLKTLGQPQTGGTVAATASAGKLNAPPPKAPFADFRVEEPGRTHKITAADLPEPYQTKSAANGPHLVARPLDVWPKAPAGFKVEMYATGLDEGRLLRTAPNGDIFMAESGGGRIRVFRGLTSDGKPELNQVFASGLKRPYGITFYPPGPDPQWIYVGNTAEVVRFPYHVGDLKARGSAEHIIELPQGGGHWTRDMQAAADGKKLYVAVGSESNIDDPDVTPGEKNRADILEINPDGSGLRVFATGIRNAGGGLAIQPETGQLWCSVNERDGLGDNLVPDYITHVEDGGFYGWPWWYIGGHQDPRHKGKHPELKDRAIVPDVLLQPHNASLEVAFYEGTQFPAEYHGDLFAAQHGSWNKAVRSGYEVIRVPLHQTGKASGEYQDFLTGFVLDNGEVWGRPVGVTVAQDGSLLVSDDGSNTIWRISWAPK
jgi:glucose/arabinose dehydrogenase